MQDTLHRINDVNPKVNAIVAMRDADDLMAEARAMDEGPRRGALHGIPIAVKDLAHVKGLTCTMGSPEYVGIISQADDIVPARMRAAGAILIGKTNTPEFGLGSHTFNRVYGATLNPYQPALSCGGSSGGAAVALATGMTSLADGSDMMGSLRNPAGWNNVYGLRPTWGLVPSDPDGDNFLDQLATLGPMARSPEDIAILLDAISGADPYDPYSYDAPPLAPLQPAEMSGKRIGWLGDWGGAMPMEDGILAQSEQALRVFEDLGAQVDVLDSPFSADAMWDAWIRLRSWQVAGGKTGTAYASGAPVKDTATWEVEHGFSLSAVDVHNASAVRSDWFRAVMKLFQQYDALVLPSAQVWPFDVNLPYPTQIAGVAMDTYHRWMQVVIPVSILGLPGLSVPAGFGAAGLPAGIQLFGPRNSDGVLLAMGQAYHNATQWPQQRPAMG